MVTSGRILAPGRWRWLSALLLTLLSEPLCAQTGYGYKRGTDPLVLGVKKVVLAARQQEWDAALEESKKLAWQFKELRTDLSIDLEPGFRAALAAKSIKRLSPEVSTLLYFAIVQKIHWNRKEKLETFTRAKSRVDSAVFYYEKILSLGVQSYDARKNRRLHEEILTAFLASRKTLGSSGLFGFSRRPPNLPVFENHATAILDRLRVVYPQVKVVEARAKREREKRKRTTEKKE